MAITFIKRSSIPVPVKGKVATIAQVTISASGQMTFSTKAVQILGTKELKKVGVAYDAATRRVVVTPKGHRSIAKWEDSDLWDLKHSSKGNSATLSGSGSFLGNPGVFGEDTYNYKDSGSQNFPVTEAKEGGWFSFQLPKGAMTPKPKIARKKKDKDAGKKTVPISTATASTQPPPALEELEMSSA